MRTDRVASRDTRGGVNALHAALAAVVLAFWVILGHGHTWVFAALMLAAIRNHRRRRLGGSRVTARSSVAHQRVRGTRHQRDAGTGSARPVRAPPRRISGPIRPRGHGPEARS